MIKLTGLIYDDYEFYDEYDFVFDTWEEAEKGS